jgi:hypothetical protein
MCSLEKVQITEYIFYCKRAILFLSSSKILTPHPPLRPASVYPPPLLRGEDRPRIREHIGSVIGGRVPAAQGSSGSCVYCRKPGVRSLYTYVAS